MQGLSDHLYAVETWAQGKNFCVYFYRDHLVLVAEETWAQGEKLSKVFIKGPPSLLRDLSAGGRIRGPPRR